MPFRTVHNSLLDSCQTTISGLHCIPYNSALSFIIGQLKLIPCLLRIPPNFCDSFEKIFGCFDLNRNDYCIMYFSCSHENIPDLFLPHRFLIHSSQLCWLWTHVEIGSAGEMAQGKNTLTWAGRSSCDSETLASLTQHSTQMISISTELFPLAYCACSKTSTKPFLDLLLSLSPVHHSVSLTN